MIIYQKMVDSILIMILLKRATYLIRVEFEITNLTFHSHACRAIVKTKISQHKTYKAKKTQQNVKGLY